MLHFKVICFECILLDSPILNHCFLHTRMMNHSFIRPFLIVQLLEIGTSKLFSLIGSTQVFLKRWILKQLRGRIIRRRRCSSQKLNRCLPLMHLRRPICGILIRSKWHIALILLNGYGRFRNLNTSFYVNIIVPWLLFLTVNDGHHFIEGDLAVLTCFHVVH